MLLQIVYALQLIPSTRLHLFDQAPHFALPDTEPGSPVHFPEPPELPKADPRAGFL